MQVYRIDENGHYIEPVTVAETVPNDCVKIRPPDGLFKAKFIDGDWIEGMEQSEIDTIVNAQVPPTDIEEIRKQQTDLVFQLMMNGVL